MKEIYLTVSVDEDYDYIGDVDVTVQMEDGMFDSLAVLVSEYQDKGEELTEEDFQQRLPEVYGFISAYVDDIMPDQINMDEGQDIDDFLWSIQYPDDICELFDE